MNSQSVQDPFARSMSAGFFLVGGIFLVVGAGMGIREYLFGRQSVPAVGTVVDLRVTESADSQNLIPVVEFRTAARDLVRFEGLSTAPPWTKGDSVPVLYREADPKDARIDSFVQRWLFPSLFTPIGVGLILAGFVKFAPLGARANVATTQQPRTT